MIDSDTWDALDLPSSNSPVLVAASVVAKSIDGSHSDGISMLVFPHHQSQRRKVLRLLQSRSDILCSQAPHQFLCSSAPALVWCATAISLQEIAGVVRSMHVILPMVPSVRLVRKAPHLGMDEFPLVGRGNRILVRLAVAVHWCACASLCFIVCVVIVIVLYIVF